MRTVQLPTAMHHNAHTRETDGPASSPLKDADQQAVAAILQGDSQAFRHLVRRHQTALFRYLYCRMQDRHTAEELTQETLLRAFRTISAGGFGGRSGIKTWLFVIARNCLVDHQRFIQVRQRERNGQEIGDDLPCQRTSGEDGPLATAARNEDRATIERGLGQLPAEQLEVIALHFYAGLSFSEIAETTGVPVATAKSRARYALVKLGQLLSSLGELP